MPSRTSTPPPSAVKPASPSSPSLTAPVADAPGPRAQAFCNAFEKALESTLRRCNYENFAACFPTPSEYRAETLDAFWRDFVGRLESFCKENFEQLLADRNVIPSLNALHTLIEEATARKLEAETLAHAQGNAVKVPVAPHTLTPEALYNTHLTPFLVSQQSMLFEQMSELQQSNAEMLQEIQRQRAEMRSILAGLEGIVGDLETNANVVAGQDVQGLVGEVRNINTELRG